jgi:hypothetical protein
MAVMAQWQGKKWEVSPERIIALEGLTTSYKLKAETNNDAAGSPSLNERGRELQPLAFTMMISDAAGVDVQAEITSWGGLVGSAGPFILAGNRFGPEKFALTEVGVTETKIDDLGRIRAAKIALTFIENAEEAAKEKPSTSEASQENPTPGISLKTASAETYTALGIGPTSTAKADKVASIAQSVMGGILGLNIAKASTSK